MANLMPFSALLQLFVTFLSLALFFSGCTTSRPPEVGLQELRVQAEERLLQDAKLAFVRADYPEAVLLLNRFVKNHGHSPLTWEGQWWLARAYEESGNLRLALGRFQRLAQDPSHHPYRHEARLRAETLIQTLGIEPLPSKITGVAMSLDDVLGRVEPSWEMSYIRQRKGAIFLIKLGCPVLEAMTLGSGALESENANWGGRLGRGLGPLVEDIVQSGKAVYLGVSLPCLGFFATGSGEETPQWHDWYYEPATQRVRPSSYFSLLSSGYQAAVLNILSKMSQWKISGMVFQEDLPSGPYEGFSPIALNSFAKAFRVHLNPVAMFRNGDPGRAGSTGGEEGSLSNVFWKWAGWKARERLRVMTELTQSLREQFPHLQFGVEIHPESLHDPVTALANFSEDWVETAHAPFDFFVARFSDFLSSGHQTHSVRGDHTLSWELRRTLVQRMVEYLEDAQRVWVIRPGRQDEVGLQPVSHQVEVEPHAWPEGVGEIVDLSSVP